MIPHRHASLGTSPRPAYWDEAQADPHHIGFAYGGLYPGRLHAKGQLVEKHEVHFSVGMCGTYLLHVGLRQPHTPWTAPSGVSPRGRPEDWQVPGSPFLLQVLPGKAYPLTTQIDASALPLRGGPESANGEKQAQFECEIVLASRDKMGNACDSGGANVTCGFIEESSSSAPPESEDIDTKTNAAGQRGSTSAGQKRPTTAAVQTRTASVMCVLSRSSS